MNPSLTTLCRWEAHQDCAAENCKCSCHIDIPLSTIDDVSKELCILAVAYWRTGGGNGYKDLWKITLALCENWHMHMIVAGAIYQWDKPYWSLNEFKDDVRRRGVSLDGRKPVLLNA